MGKPVIISDILNFSEIVSKEGLGIIAEKGKQHIDLNISISQYKQLSQNAYEYSEIHSKENYVKSIRKGYDINDRI